MTFIHPLLFGGMALVGVPILLHLLMRQKPKHLMFPAFRFLQKRAKTNQRKIRLKHFLLLLLRMLLIAILCLALIRPRLFSDRPGLSGQEVAAVILIDTSASMDYTVAGKSRLEEARHKALELLDELGPNSRILVIDSGGMPTDWGNVSQARDAIRSLTLRPGSVPVTSAVAMAWQKFDELDRQASASESETLPRFLYVFSDRTAASWDASRVSDLQAQRDRLAPPKVQSIFLDVGVEKPVDVAIVEAEAKPSIVAANQEATIRVHVQATGRGCDTEVLCRLVGEPAAERKPVKLEPGQTQVFEFKKKNLKIGQYQAEVSLVTADALMSDNVRYVTFEVRGARKILTITDDAAYAFAWEAAFVSHGEFECEVKTPSEIGSADDLKSYLAVCLFSVRRPNSGPEPLWGKLERYVLGGGHLVIVPGMDMLVEDYNTKAAENLMPGRWGEKPVTLEPGKSAVWRFGNFSHLFLSKFKEWRDLGTVGFFQRLPSATKYWQIVAPAKENVVVWYAKEGEATDPALLERVAGRKPGSGRVMLITTPLDVREEEKPWNDYLGTADRAPFILVLANEIISYMVGDKEEAMFNFNCGSVAVLPIPPAFRAPEYTLDGPGITGPETRVQRGDGDGELRVRQTHTPGNFVVTLAKPEWKSRFSLNPAGNEFHLERVPVEELEKLFGKDAVLPAGQNRPLRDAMTTRMKQPIELLPWLMGLLVIGLALEALLANRFYKDENPPTPTTDK